jgi:hypothetical protein
VDGVQFYPGNEYSGSVLIAFYLLGVLGVCNMFAKGLKVRGKMLQNDCITLYLLVTRMNVLYFVSICTVTLWEFRVRLTG